MDNQQPKTDDMWVAAAGMLLGSLLKDAIGEADAIVTYHDFVQLVDRELNIKITANTTWGECYSLMRKAILEKRFNKAISVL